jgi:hypothetical protein
MGTTAYSITQSGRYEPFNLQVARGQITNHRAISVFGYNGDVDTTEESVWPADGKIPHGQSASILKVSSSSASDASGDVGARTVLIEGLDANFNEVSETVILNGQTAVNTTLSYVAINNLLVMSVGTSDHNVGDINVGTGDVTAGVPAVLFDLIAATYNQRTTGHYTVPAGYTAYLEVGIFSAGQASGSTSVTGKILVTDNVSDIQRVGSIVTLNNGSVQFNFSYPILIPERSCIGATAVGTANNNSASSYFNILLIKNDAST